MKKVLISGMIPGTSSQSWEMIRDGSSCETKVEKKGELRLITIGETMTWNDGDSGIIRCGLTSTMTRTLYHSRRNSNNALSGLGENHIFFDGSILRRGLLVSRKPITPGSAVMSRRMVSGRKFGPPTCGLRWLCYLGL